MAPSEAQLDRSSAESDVMLDKMIIVRCQGYGWCVGKIIQKVTRGLSNFIAKFEIDTNPSLLLLERADYDVAPDADYNAWMILEPVGEEAVAEALVTPPQAAVMEA